MVEYAENQLVEDIRQRFTMDGQVTESGQFEILAITAGDGNGWNFSTATLQKSLSLWDGVECFLDHEYFAFAGRSVKDLAGVIFSPAWDEARQGIKATLRAVGPGGKVLTELGKEIVKDEAGPLPHVGFSADVRFSDKNKEVQEIIRVFSVDLVLNPARGGQFIRSLNHRLEGLLMGDEINQSQKPELQAGGKTSNQIEEDRQAVQVLLGEQKRMQVLEDEASQAREVRMQMCGYLLDSALAASKLPAAVSDRVRKQFANKVFEAKELQSQIEDARAMVSELTGGLTVTGPGRITGVFNSQDQLQAATDDLLGAPREESAKALKVARLQGIRELYLMLTGDVDLHGGYYADRTRLATTADFTGLVKNALNKIVVNTWEQLGKAGYDWWNNVVVTEHFNSLNDITGTLIGTVGDLPTVAEGAEYTELAIGDSPETASFVKYGGYIPLTLELIDRDQSRKLSAYAREMGAAGLRKISSLVAAIFTANSSVGPTMADTGALCNATAVTTAGGHVNLLTTALSQSEWDVVSSAVYNQPRLIKNAAGLIGTGPKMAVNPSVCLVPRALQLIAREIFMGDFVAATDLVYDNLVKGTAVPVTVPEWTDATDWAAVCDPRIVPAIYVGDRFGLMPEIYIAGDELSPAVFSNDEHRLKVRHFLAVWVNDFRPLHKSNVGA